MALQFPVATIETLLSTHSYIIASRKSPQPWQELDPTVNAKPRFSRTMIDIWSVQQIQTSEMGRFSNYEISTVYVATSHFRWNMWTSPALLLSATVGNNIC